MLATFVRTKHTGLRVHLGARCLSVSTPLARRHIVAEGTVTDPDEDDSKPSFPSRSPYYFETGYSIFAKRLSRPFPPPFLSKPSGSFSEPLTTHNHIRDRRPQVEGHPVKGITNGDDAIVIGGQNFLGVNDGVGAWAQKERGIAALWSRLIAHFYVLELEKKYQGTEKISLEDLDPTKHLQTAYESTQSVTKEPQEILGTTTVSSALLHHRSDDQPVILATNLGDCAVFVIRPTSSEVIYNTKEQWHWFDCPRQLGTNSDDTPNDNAVTDVVDIQENDVVAVVSDGVTDNLWDTEIAEKISKSVKMWQDNVREAQDGMVFVARELMNAAREVAQDPYAESPYMERALDEGIAAEGGKLDDISVVVGLCKKRK